MRPLQWGRLLLYVNISLTVASVLREIPAQHITAIEMANDPSEAKNKAQKARTNAKSGR